ncbi:TIM-barrel domain-containing protein, partial [Paenibacillus riograndensis]
TTDIGGFHGGNPADASFRELMVRWFQYGAFSPVFRLHGDRSPFVPPTGTRGGGVCGSGSDNEVWSYGEEAYAIFKEFMQMRERLKPYIRGLMEAAHEKGTPPMRPLFYDFPQDPAAWDIEDQYMFGPDLLVAPVLGEGERARKVYLPSGSEWTHVYTGTAYAGGQAIRIDAPLTQIPLFVRDGAVLPVLGGAEE